MNSLITGSATALVRTPSALPPSQLSSSTPTTSPISRSTTLPLPSLAVALASLETASRRPCPPSPRSSLGWCLLSSRWRTPLSSLRPHEQNLGHNIGRVPYSQGASVACPTTLI